MKCGICHQDKHDVHRIIYYGGMSNNYCNDCNDTFRHLCITLMSIGFIIMLFLLAVILLE